VEPPVLLPTPDELAKMTFRQLLAECRKGGPFQMNAAHVLAQRAKHGIGRR